MAMVGISVPAIFDSGRATTRDLCPRRTSPSSIWRRICSAPPTDSGPTIESQNATLSTVKLTLSWMKNFAQSLRCHFPPRCTVGSPVEIFIPKLAIMRWTREIIFRSHPKSLHFRLSKGLHGSFLSRETFDHGDLEFPLAGVQRIRVLRLLRTGQKSVNLHSCTSCVISRELA